MSQREHRANLSWDERLFGARLWSRGSRPFDPFESDDWRQIPVSLRTLTADSAEAAEKPSLEVASTTWSGADRAVGPDEAACGWVPLDFPLASGEPAELTVIRADLLRAGAVGLLLMAIGLVRLFASKSLRLSLAVITFAAAMAWIVPVIYVPAVRSVFLGGAVGLLWACCPRRTPRIIRPDETTKSHQTPGNSQSFIIATTTSGVWILMWLFPSSGWSQDPAPVAAIPTYNVLSPVDEEQQPKGDYLFVPREMYDAIYRRSNEPFGAHQAALLESAEYRVALARPDDSETKLLVREITAEFSLRSLHRVTTFMVPMRRDRFRVVEVNLDGQPLNLEWNEEETSFRIPLEAVGSHRVRIVARPLQATAESSGEFAVAIPRCPRSKVTVEAPRALDRLEFPGAQGAISRDEVAGEVVAELGPLNELRFRWDVPAGKTPTVLDSDVAEMLWLHVQNNSLTVHGKFRFTARSGTIGQVTLRVDRRLNLLPIAKDQPIATVETEQGESQLIRCWLDRPQQDVTLQLSFSMSGNGGVGRWRLPRVTAEGTRRSPAWFGVTATEGMIAEISPGSVTAKIAPSQFMALWNEEREPPQQAFAATSDVDQWQLVVRPAPPRIALQEEQDVLITNDSATFQYEALVAAEQGRITRLNLYVPARFEPRQLIVLHDDANRLLRWSRASDRELTVFLTVPLSGELRVVMEGTVPLPRGRHVRLPLIAAANASPGPRRVNFYQANDVRLQVLESAGLEVDPRNLGSLDWGRVVTSLTDSGRDILQPSVLLSIEPNRPRVQGSMVTRMALEGEEWRAITELHLAVLSGSIDSVRMRLPDEYAGQIQISPPVEQQLYPASGESGRLLVARFPAAVEHELKLTIATDLNFSTGEPIRVPEIQVFDVAPLDRYLVLPTRLQRQKALWEISGLQSAELPEDHSLQPLDGDVGYRAVGGRVQAVLSEVERLTGTPQVHLADYQIRWSTDRRYRGVATFYLEPSRLSEIELAMPEAVTPLHVRVAGLPVSGRRTDPNHWRVPLGPEMLPQLVEVLFEGEWSGKPSRDLPVTVAGPTVTGIPTLQTLFTVQSPGGEWEGTPLLTHTAATAAELDAVRIKTLEDLRQRGMDDASRANSSERDAWRNDWDARIRQITARRLAEVPAANGDDQVRADPGTPIGMAGQWFVEAQHRGPQIHCALEGAVPQISVRYPRWIWRQVARQVGSVVLLIGGIIGASWFAGSGPCLELWRRSPQLFIALAGFLWWLFFTPSFIGLLVLAFAAVSALRPSWKSFPA